MVQKLPLRMEWSPDYISLFPLLCRDISNAIDTLYVQAENWLKDREESVGLQPREVIAYTPAHQPSPGMESGGNSSG